uniref:Ceramide synthase 4b n=1 Tax=Neolamprologus brichardi TaxID=32507 RepID=A0A3Q4M1Y6_NEOBR
MELLPDLWKEDYWLPPGVTWRDMEQMGDSNRPRPLDLLIALPLALGFVALRYMFERTIRTRCIRASLAPPQLILCCVLFQSEMEGLMLSCRKTQRQIETWFKRRRSQDKASKTKKFGEAAVLPTVLPVFKVQVFYKKNHLYICPPQPMERAHYWYYMLELGFYGSLLLRISVDVKRKDFKEQVVHHLATIFLLSFSYCANYIRIGTLVMLLHDSSDILLEPAKMFNYGAGWGRSCDTLFVMFAVIFLVTRLVIFPSKIIHTTLVLSMEVFEPFAGYYFFNILLMVLQGLHIFWAKLILRMVYKFLKGKVRKSSEAIVRHEMSLTCFQLFCSSISYVIPLDANKQRVQLKGRQGASRKLNHSQLYVLIHSPVVTRK